MNNIRRRPTAGNWAMRPVAQLDVTTGELLRVFGSYADAGRWVDNALGYESSQSTGCTIGTQIFESGYAYGFCWALYDNDAALVRAEKKRTKPVEVTVLKTRYPKRIVFSSTAEAARLLTVPVEDVRGNIGINKPLVDGYMFRWVGQPDPPKAKLKARGPYEIHFGNSVKVANTLREAGEVVGVTRQGILNAVNTGRPIKGKYFIRAENAKPRTT